MEPLHPPHSCRRPPRPLAVALVLLATAPACTRAARARFEGTRPAETLVEVLPSAAEVAVDGKPVGSGSQVLPAIIRDRAPHRVVARAAGFRPAERDVPAGGLAGLRIGLALAPEGFVGALDLDEAVGLVRAAAFLSSAGRSREALEYARRAVVIDPEYAPAHRVAGDAAAAAGDRRAAVASWAEYLRLAPDASDAGEVEESMAEGAEE